jgi:hypothetical protein
MSLQEEAIMSEHGPSDERLEAIYDRLDELDPNTFESRAAELLHGLGFSRVMMERKTKDMSGEGACCLRRIMSRCMTSHSYIELACFLMVGCAMDILSGEGDANMQLVWYFQRLLAMGSVGTAWSLGHCCGC